MSEFDKADITYFGCRFTSEGLKPDPRKLEAVLNYKNQNPKKL